MVNSKTVFKNNFQQVLFVFLAFFGMVLVSYVYVSGIVNKQMLLICDGILDTTETVVSAHILERELSFLTITKGFEEIILSENSNEEMRKYLEEQTAFYIDEHISIPDFIKIFCVFQGEFIDGAGWVPPDSWDPLTQPWYIGAMENSGGIFFSEPYISSETGTQIISFSKIITGPAGEVYGVLGIDLNLTKITDYVRNQKIVNNGYGVLLTDQLIFAVHPNPELVGLSMNRAGGDYRNFTYMLVNRYPVTAERFTDYNGVDSIAFFRTIFNGWHIGVITPRDAYYQSVYNLAFVLGIMGFLLMVSLSYLLVTTRIKQMKAVDENKSKSTFLARMSHEMRTPMNAIIGMTQIARKSNDPERIQNCLGKINDASTHLLGVINDVLDMSKIEAGKLELVNTDFNLHEMIDKVVDVVSFKIDEKKQNLGIDIREDVPAYIHGDRQLLAQVLTNLLTNAYKFTPEGGNIDLTVINLLKTEQDKNVLQFSVKDNGIGITPEQQEKLFKPFEQADDSVSRKYGGTGLGLGISKRIVEMMGGSISVESEAGKGSCFIFTIEAKAAAEQPKPKPDEKAAETKTYNFSGKRILLTEDIAINREIIVTLLEDTHVVIDCAENGFEACRLFEQNPEQYDLIFMDIHMPEMDGYESSRRIRSVDNEKAKTIPIIAMTADVFREDVEKMLHSGMDDHIGKPVEIKEILKKMKKYLG